jgi:hypothetical protein
VSFGWFPHISLNAESGNFIVYFMSGATHRGIG